MEATTEHRHDPVDSQHLEIDFMNCQQIPNLGIQLLHPFRYLIAEPHYGVLLEGVKIIEKLAAQNGCHGNKRLKLVI